VKVLNPWAALAANRRALAMATPGRPPAMTACRRGFGPRATQRSHAMSSPFVIVLSEEEESVLAARAQSVRSQYRDACVPGSVVVNGAGTCRQATPGTAPTDGDQSQFVSLSQVGGSYRLPFLGTNLGGRHRRGHRPRRSRRPASRVARDGERRRPYGHSAGPFLRCPREPQVRYWAQQRAGS
jgi:hypothetical protein